MARVYDYGMALERRRDLLRRRRLAWRTIGLLGGLMCLWALTSVARGQAPALTTVQDSAYLGTGTVTLVLNHDMTTPDGKYVPQGQEWTVTLSGGAFSVALPPNVGSLPSNTSYTAYYNVTPGGQYSRTWIVPASATPVGLATVQSAGPAPTPTVMFPLSQITPPSACASELVGESASGLNWQCYAALVNPMTTAGDLIVGGTGGAADRLGAGTAGFVLTSTGPGSQPNWQAAAAAGVSSFNGRTGAVVPVVNDYGFSLLSGTATLAQLPQGCTGCVLLGQGASAPAYVSDPEVQGLGAAGAATTGNPVLVGGSDGTNTRTLLTDTSGHAVVNINGTVPVSGTFWQATQPVSLSSLPALATGSNTIGGVNQAGSWTVAISGTPAVSVSGNVGMVGTASDNTANSTAKLPVIPAVANTAAPTYTSGDQVPLSTDTGGNLRVTCANCSGGSGGTAMGDAGSYTQGTTGFTPIGGEYNSSPTSLTSGQAGAALMTATRHLVVNVDDFPATQPVSGTVTANAGTGTFNIAGAVTANVGTTGGLALDATLQGLLLGQGSSTSGQKGPLMLGAVTTAAPSYTTTQTSPLSLTTAGALRIDGSAVTQPVSGSVTVSNLPGTQPVSGTVTANQGTAGAGSSPWPVQPEPTSATAQAPTAYTTTNLTSAATIDSSPGNLFHYEATNSGTAVCYVEFFNAVSGSVTLGTTAPIWTVPLLATANNGYSRNSAPTVGGLFSFGTALSAAAVTTAGGSTTCPANVITLNAGYK